MGSPFDLSSTEITDEQRTVEVFLQPGEFFWGDRFSRIWTILGSCVAVCVWNEGRQVGGMNHILLPGISPDGAKIQGAPAKYAVDAIDVFLKEMRREKLAPHTFVAKVFGGSSLMESVRHSVGVKNAESVRSLLAAAGIPVVAEDLGGSGHRKVIFNLDDGSAWVRNHH